MRLHDTTLGVLGSARTESSGGWKHWRETAIFGFWFVLVEAIRDQNGQNILSNTPGKGAISDFLCEANLVLKRFY